MKRKDLNVQTPSFLKLNKQAEKIYLNFSKVLKKNLKNKNFAIAISGGPDSLALAYLSQVYCLRENYKSQPHYLIVDHKIRKNSKTEALYVKKILKKIGVNAKILNNPKAIKKSIQQEARNIRYELLSNYCKKNSLSFLLTAHHKNDQIETFLIRLSRGSGIRGLSAMQEKTKIGDKIYLIRPFLKIFKSDLISIAKKYFVKPVNDPSNKDTKFLRTKIRKITKYLELSGINLENINKSIENINSANLILNTIELEAEKKCVKRYRHKKIISMKKLKKYPDEILIKVISKTLKDTSKNYYPPRAKKIQNLIKIIDKRTLHNYILGGCTISCDKTSNLEVSKCA
mgnify:FL=1